MSQTNDEEKATGFDYATWYQENRTRLSEKKAKRYKEDKKYREAALTRSRSQRKTKTPTPANGYTVTFQDMATTLDVTVWVLREWRRKDYFPEPQRRDGRLWFKPEQVALLNMLKTFFKYTGVRVAAAHRQELNNTVDLIAANW